MKPSELIKDGNVDVSYYGDNYIQNQFTAIATFRTAIGEHKTWMRFPLQMIKDKSPEEMKNIMVCHLNKFIHTDLFGRAFNMVKRLKQTK